MAYISDMPWVSSSNGQGQVQVNETSAGSAIWLGGINYSEGLGVTANSQVDRQSRRHVLAIPIGNRRRQPGRHQRVVFNVYGDGTCCTNLRR